jgi:hypothetical protein
MAVEGITHQEMRNSCRILLINRLGDMEVDKIDMKIGLRKTRM